MKNSRRILLIVTVWALLVGPLCAHEPIVYVSPENPQPGDTVQLLLQGWLPDPCNVKTIKFSGSGPVYTFDITATQQSGVCITVVDFYGEAQELIGLEEGLYTVRAVETLYQYYPWVRVNTFETSFVVGDSAAVLNECTPCVAGDADGSGICNIGDAVYLIARIFSGGPGPVCEAEGDADVSGSVNISDVSRLVMFIFGGAPLEPCGDV